MFGKSFVSVALLSWTLAGCAATGAPDPVPNVQQEAPPAEAEATTLVEGPTALSITALGSQAQFAEMALPIVSGQVQLSSDAPDSITVESVEVSLKDIVFDEVVANTAGFRDVKVSLAKPVTTTLSRSLSGDGGFATLNLDLELNWSLVTNDGITVPLGTQHIANVPVQLGVYTNESGGLVVDLYGEKKGKVLSSGISDLSDLAFDLYAEG